MFRKRESFKFKGRKHSVRGNFSVIIGCFVLILFFITVGISGSQGGNSGSWIGLTGFSCFFLSIIGFILGYIGFKEQDIYYIAPLTGVIINGLLMILYLSLYFIGFMS